MYSALVMWYELGCLIGFHCFIYLIVSLTLFFLLLDDIVRP